MPALDAKLILAALGPLFLVLGLVRCLRGDTVGRQGRTWLLVGAIFSAVALWLWSRASQSA